MNTADQSSISALAYRFLVARIELVLAGGEDSSFVDLEAGAKIYGDLPTAAEAMIGAVEQKTRDAREAAKTANAERQARMNTPEAQAQVAEMFRLYGEAEELERKVACGGGPAPDYRARRIAELVEKGVDEEAARAAVDRKEPEQKTGATFAIKAKELRQKAALIEVALAKGEA
jgi:hypothetical protein